MKSDNIEEWIIQWFKEQNNGKLPDHSDNIMNENYFKLNLIDSFGVITLIDAIETEFKITLSQDHFEQRRFSTMNGLIEIVREEIQNNGSLQ